MSTEPEDHDDGLDVDNEPDAASLTDLKVAQQRSGLSAGSGQKAGDITDQLARIKLPGEAELSAQPVQPTTPVATPSQPPLRAVRDLDSAETIPPAPSERPRPTEQLQQATQQVAASVESNDMGHAETQQELLYWPNSMVLTCGPPDGRGDVTILKVTRIADQNVTPSASGANRVEYTPMLTEWILSLGKAAAASGKPMQESDRFPTNEGLVRYQIILLPLSDEQTRIDHVLCHVYRA